MKFYNPFKAHIAYHPEHGYFVRRGSFIGWEYLDNDTNYWWFGFNYAKRWASMNSLKKARDRIVRFKLPKPKAKWSFVE